MQRNGGDCARRRGLLTSTYQDALNAHPHLVEIPNYRARALTTVLARVQGVHKERVY